MLYGREPEHARIDRLLADARAGRSGVLVIRGEAGIGKSALLEHAEQSAAGMRVVRGLGVEAESELAFAGLHLLLGEFADRLDALPATQAVALRAAFGLGEATAGDRFLAGLATLSLLNDLAEEHPLVVLVDDAHWIDRASLDALSFAARRLGAEGVALILVARDGHPFPDDGLGVLHLTGIDEASGDALLTGHAGGLASHVKERILREARGNPLALQELPVTLTAAQRAGEVPLAAPPIGAHPVSGLVEQSFVGRIRSLPAQTRWLLLIAAADDTRDMDVVLRAGGQQGGGVRDLEPAEDGRFVQVSDGRLLFTHPLIRSAAYRGATESQRVSAHRALAAVTEDDRRAWHLAAATIGTDEAVAAELVRGAEAARDRGGYAAVTTAYQRAGELSPDPALRTDRLAAAARAAATAGQLELAVRLADGVAPQVDDPLLRAELARVKAAAADEQGDGQPGSELATAAVAIAGDAPDAAAFMLVDAMTRGWGRGDPAAVEEVAAGIARLEAPEPTLDRAVTALEYLAVGNLQSGLPLLRELLAQIRGDAGLALWERASLQWWDLMSADVTGAHREATALVRDCREQGAIGMLPRALMLLVRSQLLLGHYQDLVLAADEGVRIAEDTSMPYYAAHLRGLRACVAAIQGDEELCGSLIEKVHWERLGEQDMVGVYALLLLDVGLGRHDAVMRRFDRISTGPSRHFALEHVHSLPNYVEAAVRTERPELADELSARFGAWADATGQTWPRAIALRCRALATPGAEAGARYEEAVTLHQQDGVQPFELARTELLYGEWLRRRRRRNDARRHLKPALESFERLAAHPWAQRARTELRAAGESSESAGTRQGLLERLTPQELHVVRLAAAGLTNRDIGAQLLLSPRTVGYHLYKAYPKLGVASRNDLARMNLS